jgi:hypothetical protein
MTTFLGKITSNVGDEYYVLTASTEDEAKLILNGVGAAGALLKIAPLPPSVAALYNVPFGKIIPFHPATPITITALTDPAEK